MSTIRKEASFPISWPQSSSGRMEPSLTTPFDCMFKLVADHVAPLP